MRNLYKSINSHPLAKPEQVAQAIGKCLDRSAAEASNRILMNPKTKVVYDAAHNTVGVIAELRSRMNVSSSASWRQIAGDDYALPPRPVDPGSYTSGPAKEMPQSGGGKSSNTGCLFTVAVVVIIGLVIAVNNSKAPVHQTTPRPLPPPPPLSTIPYKPLPPPVAFPGHGTVTTLVAGPFVAPLTISTSPGGYYYIKLVPIGSKSPAVILYLHGGRSHRTLVPLGTYELKYATGSTWYGSTDYFGPATVYSRADSSFHFTQTAAGYSVSAHPTRVAL